MSLTNSINPTIKNTDKCSHIGLFKDQNVIPLLQATVKSNLINCRYFFQIKTEFNSFLCNSLTPSIEIPIILYIPDIRQNVQIYQPKIWKPSIMPIVDINFPSFDDGKLSSPKNNRMTEFYPSRIYNSEGIIMNTSDALQKPNTSDNLQKISSDRIHSLNSNEIYLSNKSIEENRK